MPALTWFYGVLPWEVEQFTFAEIQVYTAWMNDYLQAQQKGR